MLYTAATFEEICKWAERLSPDRISKEALERDGTLFFRDYEDSVVIHYLESQPIISVKLWEGDERLATQHKNFPLPEVLL